jgi:hypothetical protein
LAVVVDIRERVPAFKITDGAFVRHSVDSLKTIQICYFGGVKLPITREHIRLPRPRVGAAVLSLTLLSSLAAASEYCTKEQYGRDHALIADAFSSGMLVKGPKELRESILVQEGEWYKMNYTQQAVFMQSFECSLAGPGSPKKLLYMDVRSLATGTLLATWTLGVLKPAMAPHDVTNPGMPEVTEDENRIGLTGEARAAFIKSATDECNKRANSAPPTYCSCYANAMADSVSVKELEMAAKSQEAGMTALQPKLAAAARRCQAGD